MSSDYATHTRLYCNPQEAMNATNLDDARQECNKKQSCEMFYDYCGRLQVSSQKLSRVGFSPENIDRRNLNEMHHCTNKYDTAKGF